MSATPKTLNGYPVDALLEQEIVEVREWERFKWLARGLEHVKDQYDVARLEALLDTPPTMPGQREKVVVLLALKANESALDALEALDTADSDDSFHQLHRVALRYARQQMN